MLFPGSKSACLIVSLRHGLFTRAGSVNWRRVFNELTRGSTTQAPTYTIRPLESCETAEAQTKKIRSYHLHGNTTCLTAHHAPCARYPVIALELPDLAGLRGKPCPVYIRPL